MKTSNFIKYLRISIRQSWSSTFGGRYRYSWNDDWCYNSWFRVVELNVFDHLNECSSIVYSETFRDLTLPRVITLNEMWDNNLYRKYNLIFHRITNAICFFQNMMYLFCARLYMVVSSTLWRERYALLKVIYHPLHSMNKFVTNKSKLPQGGAQVFPYMAIM